MKKENLTQKNIIILVCVLVIILVAFYVKKSNPVVDDVPSIIVPSHLSISDQDKANQEIKEINEKINSNKCIETGAKACYDEYLQRGIKYESLGEISNAINSYQKARDISPKDYVPYSNIGSAYYGIQKFPEAETALLKALTFSPDNVSIYTKLYEVYFHGMKRNPEQMAGFFKDAIEKTHGNINIVKLYALYLEDIKDPESALPIWQGLLKVEPDNASYKTKVEALQKQIKAYNIGN
jgi:tetratricopeptide (TPR) repeat protein